MKSVVLIGGTISNMISAIELADLFKITIFELNAEIGLPSISPGIITNIHILEGYLTSEQLQFLQPNNVVDGYALRSEWVLKHLAVVAAEKGVEIFTRTRITQSFSTEQGYSIEYIGAGPNTTGQIDCDFLVDDRQWTYNSPGSKQHNIKIQPTILPDFGQFIDIHGGTALTSDCAHIPNDVISFSRHEGLTEVWQTDQHWIPLHGWIESISCSLPIDQKQRTIDAQIVVGKDTAFHLKGIN